MKGRRFPTQGWLGLALIAIFWPLNWFLPGRPSAYLFFPLWLGYALAMDGLVFQRTGTSLLTRSRRGFIGLFVASAPAWWLFEWINHRTQNWIYLGAEEYSTFSYMILCTISFSTVMPAVFETTEWIGSFRWVERFRNLRRTPATQITRWIMFLTGLIWLTLALILPHAFYPLVWGAIVLILDPINGWLGRRSFLDKLQHGDWRLVAALSAGSLICGFFWELWNYYSWPKWTYHTPGAQFLHVFEMPLLGYIGYLPFAWEIYAIRNLLWKNAPSLPLERGERESD